MGWKVILLQCCSGQRGSACIVCIPYILHTVNTFTYPHWVELTIMNISMVPLNILRSVRTMRVGNESSSEPIFYPIMHSGPPEKVHSQSRNQEILHQIFVNGGPTVSNAPRTRRSCFEADFFFLCPHRDLIVAKSWLLTFRDWSIYFCAIFADRIDTWSCHRRRPCLFCPSSESYWGTPVKAWRSPRIVIHWLDTKMRVIARFAERKSESFNKADDFLLKSEA